MGPMGGKNGIAIRNITRPNLKALLHDVTRTLAFLESFERRYGGRAFRKFVTTSFKTTSAKKRVALSPCC